MYPYIYIFGHSIGTYGIIAVVAAVLCGFLFIISLGHKGIIVENGLIFLMFVIFGVILGSHLLYAITQYRYIPYLFQKTEFLKWIARFQYIFGGSVFYGGLLGGMGLGYVGLRCLKQSVPIYSDLMAPIIPLFHGMTRIGCFLAGCCYGIPCTWGFAAEGNTLVPEVNGITRFPVQLLESLLNFALAGVLFILLRYSRFRSGIRGNLLKIYLIIYGIIRFCGEFLRGDVYRGMWGIFSTSQWISIVTVGIATVIWIKNIIQKRNLLQAE